MWETILEIIERRWAEHQSPRRQLVRDICGLYNAMSSCYDSYSKFSQSSDSATTWLNDVEDLKRCLRRVDPTLAIFAPDVRPVIRNYVMMEAWETRAGLLQQDGTGREVLLLDLFGLAFHDARERLAEFIKKNFTVEETHVLLRGRL